MNVLIWYIQKYLDSMSEDELIASYNVDNELKYISSFRIQAHHVTDTLRRAIVFHTRSAIVRMPYSLHLLMFAEMLGELNAQYADSEIVSEILEKINGYIFETVKDDFSNAQEIVETIIETLDWLGVYLNAFLEKMEKAWEKKEEELSRS